MHQHLGERWFERFDPPFPSFKHFPFQLWTWPWAMPKWWAACGYERHEAGGAGGYWKDHAVRR
jgi:hypothetical protein